jgi:Cu(I)/Ag(I) efflux system membrane fusion protein
MSAMKAALSISLAAGFALAALGGYWLGQRAPHVASRETPNAIATPAAEPGRKVLYWYDPMYPQQRFDKPGKSPFMDMVLQPKYADGTSENGGVTINPRVAQNLGIRTAEVQPGSLEPKLSAVGSIAYNERAIVLVQPRVNGFVERLHVRAPLDPVRKGEPLVDILFPEWVAAQEELLLLMRRDTPDAAALRSAARQRLVLLGMREDEIAAVEREGRVQNRVTLRSPIAGIVAELGAREGMTVMAGATLFRIAGLDTVWVVAEVPEAQTAWVVPGSAVEARVPAYPAEIFTGKVGAILPEINPATRTVRTRIEVANRAGKLKPGMYATLRFAARGRRALVVPSEAVIHTGARSVVILAEGEGGFRAVEVEAGMESAGYTELRKGVRAGDRVVVSGQFLIDSEASLRSAVQRLSVKENDASAAPRIHRGTGIVRGIDTASRRIELEHDPIATLQWPAMTMGFALLDATQAAHLQPGDAVEFDLRGEPSASHAYEIVRIAPRQR